MVNISKSDGVSLGVIVKSWGAQLQIRAPANSESEPNRAPEIRIQ